MKINDLVGIPYEFLGETTDGADCIGLLKMYYRMKGWPLVESDGQPIEHDWFERDRYRLVRYFLKHFDKTRDISEATEGSVVLFEINGESHTGIVIDSYGKFLTTFPPISKFNGGISFVDRLKYYMSIPGVKFIACFNRRAGDN